jgi:hypothetical protein
MVLANVHRRIAKSAATIPIVRIKHPLGFF